MTVEPRTQHEGPCKHGVFGTVQVACFWIKPWRWTLFDRRPSSSHMSLSVTQVPPFNFKKCLDFSLPPSPDFEGFSCATVWDYSIRKLCKCWEAGFIACGKQSGRFLDSLVPRQTAKCWHAVCEFLFENWAPQLRVCRCWRMWLALALCLATCMWVFYRRIISVVLSLFMLLI